MADDSPQIGMASALLPWRPEVVYLASDSRLIVRGGRHTGVRFWAAGNRGRKGGEKSGRAGEIGVHRETRGRNRARREERAGEADLPTSGRAGEEPKATPRPRGRVLPRRREKSLPPSREDQPPAGPRQVLWSSARLPSRLLWSAAALVLRRAASSGPPLLWSSASSGPLSRLLKSSVELPPLLSRY